VLGIIALLAVGGRLAWKYRHFLSYVAIFSHLKVIISFMTVVATLDVQFGVAWPPSFARALDALLVVSFDFGAILGGFCVVDLSFFQRLLSTTLMLLAAVAVVAAGSRTGSAHEAERRHTRGVFIAFYLLLFAYPVVSVRVVEAFACHEVEGVRYLRADYSVRCDTPEWRTMAAYAGVWVAVYVVAFPLFILLKLWSYRSNDTLHKEAKTSKELVGLRFLLSDYKTCVPALMWEGIEMCRKLLLSVIGSFWSTKSTMCIATACLISTFFLTLHATYHPFKGRLLNRLQTIALVVLTLLYFIGILLKTETVEESDHEDLGMLMVLLLVAVIAITVGTVVLEIYLARQWISKVSHAFKIMYEGKVHNKKGVGCVASFPGKYEDEWNQIIELGSNEIARRSIACVFLPKHTPRFGTHEVDDERTDGKILCFCDAIYGQKKVGLHTVCGVVVHILWFLN
jgi:hypothetical protein